MSLESPTLADVWELFRETDRIIREQRQETERRFQETERLIKEQAQETERRSQETDQKIKKVTEELGKLGNRFGEFVEESVRPSAVRLFLESGIDVHEVHSNIESSRGTESMEVDLLVVNDTDVIAIECKSNLSIKDIKDHLARLAKLKRLMPTYTNRRVLGAVAAMVIRKDVAQYVAQKGLYVIGQNGENLELRNQPDFSPAVW